MERDSVPESHARMYALRKHDNGGIKVATNSNFLVKVSDAKMPAVKKALEEAGIEVRSIIALHKEETGGGEEAPQEEVSE